MSKNQNLHQETELTEAEAIERAYQEKKAARRAAITETNSLAIDESLRKPGMQYRLCNVTPGNIEKYKSMGYEVTQNPIHVGKGTVDEAKSAHGCIEVEVGRSSSLKAIWMETSDENYKILRDIDAEKAKAQDDRIFESEIPEENRIGTITKDLFK